MQGTARRLAADLKPYAGKVLEEAGEEFLNIVQSYIESLGNVDTGKPLASFTKGASGNIWELNLGGLTLTIGTNVEYAKWVNDGHRQKPGRFVPGIGKEIIFGTAQELRADGAESIFRSWIPLFRQICAGT